MEKPVNKKNYLNNKIAREKQQEEIPRREICLKCLRPQVACFCHTLCKVQTDSRIVILMHPKEHRKIKVNTGRLTHLSLKNSTIIIGESFENNDEVNNIIKDETNEAFLLYPGENSHNVSRSPLPSLRENIKQRVFFIIDGTWPHAKSMMKKSVNLHPLKRVSFDVTIRSRFSIKHQPADYCLSTLESTFLLLKNLSRHQQEKSIPDSMTDVLDKMVEYQIACSQDESRQSYRSGRFKHKSERKVSKKHIKRSICFKDMA